MIPLKLETLLAGRTVEQNRVEYKEGWNPNDIIHTICAFANDLHNVNGGYLVIGIRAEDGIPVLPPKGLPMNILDSVQQEIFQYCNLITPRYIPRIEVIITKIQGFIFSICGAVQETVDRIRLRWMCMQRKERRKTAGCSTG